jgi:hypothetical protein
LPKAARVCALALTARSEVDKLETRSATLKAGAACALAGARAKIDGLEAGAEKLAAGADSVLAEESWFLEGAA